MSAAVSHWTLPKCIGARMSVSAGSEASPGRALPQRSTSMIPLMDRMLRRRPPLLRILLGACVIQTQFAAPLTQYAIKADAYSRYPIGWAFVSHRRNAPDRHSRVPVRVKKKEEDRSRSHWCSKRHFSTGDSPACALSPQRTNKYSGNWLSSIGM